MPDSPPSRRLPREPISAALTTVLLAAVAEGAVAARAAATGSGGFGDGTGAFLGAFALTLAVLGPAGLLLGWLAGLPTSRLAGRILVSTFGGTSSDNPGVALLALGSGLAATLAIVVRAGPEIIASMTAPFAAAGLGIATLATLAVLVFPTAAAGQLAARALAAPLGSTRGRELQLPLALALVGLAAVVVGRRLLPAEWIPLPAALAFGLALASWRAVGGRTVRLLGGRGLPLALVVIVLVNAAGLLSISRLSDRSRRALLYQAPYAASIISAGRRLTDDDGDGFSDVLYGGDCDDDDPAVHPGARDVAGNGIDEDCSGRDATRFSPPLPPASRRPEGLPAGMNVVLVLLDALRPDHVGYEGYSRPTTPRLDRFQKEAIWFERAYTPAPNTNFSLASIFTGFDFRRVPHRVSRGARFALGKKAETVAERLAKSGYDTVGYTISYVLQHITGMGQGFRIWKTPWKTKEWRKAFGRAAALTTDAAIEYLGGVPEEGGKPYFLYLHYRFAHDPYRKHKEWDFGDAPVDRYDSAIAYGDRELGRLLDHLDGRGDAGRTAVIICSDHGELFGDHGFTAHGQTLYEADTRIVLLARIPGIEPRGIDTPVLLTDIAPTVLDLAGVTRKPKGEGWSLFTHLDPAKKPPERPFFLYTYLRRAAIHRQLSGVLRWPLKLIRDQRGGAEELYDVARNPEETENLVDSRPDDHRELIGLLEAYEAYVAKKK